MAKKYRSGRGKRGNLLGTALFALALLVLYLGSLLGLFDWGDTGAEIGGSPAPDAYVGLQVHYIDVGQGDSTLIICDGEAMLIDAGIVSAGKTVVEYLESCGVTELSYVVCTHAHTDHCGGLDDVIEAFPVETLFAPYTEFDSSGTFTSFEDAAADVGLYITIPPLGSQFTLGGAVFTFIGPVGDYSDVNDTSLVTFLEYEKTSFLLMGDAGIGALLDSATIGGFSLDCDVLTLGHHGSKTSTDAQILDLTTPSLAVASCGFNNSYGHPHDEVLDLLTERSIPLYRTDERSSFVIGSDGEKIYAP